jgi:hypothetical protein
MCGFCRRSRPALPVAGRVRRGKKEFDALQAERGDYERLARQYDAEEQKVAAVNSLWTELQSVNLKPEDWTRFPLSVSKVLDWKDVERLLILSSNRLKDDPGYYFKPEMLRLSRVVVDGNGQPVAPGGETPVPAPASESATEMGVETAGLAPVQKYDTAYAERSLFPDCGIGGLPRI